jgi:hypothetical protein
MVNAGFGSVNVKKGHDPEREERAQQWRSTPLRLYELNEALVLLINEIYPNPSLSDSI